PRLARIGHRNRKRNQTWSRFEVTHSDASVFAPHVDNWCATAVIAGVHAEIILLVETWVQWDEPVRAALVRAALKRPQRRMLGAALCVDLIVIVGPLENLQL